MTLSNQSPDPRRVVGPGFYEQVYAAVREVPPGFVTTYGDVAGHLGSRRVARHVGYALAALTADRVDVPWHRVVASDGRVPVRGTGGHSRQRSLLRQEGVQTDRSGRVRGFATRRFPGFAPNSPPPTPSRVERKPARRNV